MAEATGLVLGGIALASLVTTCVEFVEYFEDGRDCMRDFTLAVTKVKLMEVRLGQLGELGGIEHLLIQPDGITDTNNDWHHVASALPQSLLGIQDIIQRTTELCSRYCHGGGYEDSKLQVAAQSSTQQRIESSAQIPQAGRRAMLRGIKRKTSWALHDKKKFDALIADFDFILSNLEKIIESPAAKTKPKPSQENLPIMSEGHHTPAGRMNESRKRVETPSPSNKPDAHAGEIPAPSPGPDRVRAPAATTTPTSVLETAYVENAVRNQGFFAMGGQRDPTNMMYRGNVVHDQSFGLAGDLAVPLMQEAFKAWGLVASHAVTINQQGQAKASPVGRARSEINGDEICKLTGKPVASGVCRV